MYKIVKDKEENRKEDKDFKKLAQTVMGVASLRSAEQAD